MAQLDDTWNDLLVDVMNNGVDKGDRTGTGTRSVFGRQVRFGVDLDSFPIITEKKIHWNSLISELVWFVKGKTNTDFLHEHGVGIWDQWADEETNRASNVYGKQWRNWEVSGKKPVEVDKRSGPDEGPVLTPEFENMDISDDDDLCGESFENSRGVEFRVIEKTGVENGNSTYTIQFKETNSVVDHVPRPRVRYGEVKDPYHPSVKGVGCFGEPNHKEEDWYDRAYNMWNSMLGRCYDEQHPNYDQYGAKGAYVSPRWKNFEYFIEDIKNLPFFDEWLNGEDYCLDKDYYGSNCYSEDTCIFLSEEENRLYSQNTPIIVNDEKLFVTQKEFAERHDLDGRRVSEQIRGERQPYNGWNIKRYKNDDKVVRYERSIDQLQRTIENIRNNPDSRRHLVSAWNVGELNRMGLPPCHFAYQFYSKPTERGRELSVKVEIRSNDLFIGAPFNFTSYSVLLCLVANLTDHRPGEVVYSIGDAHIYQNHFEQVEKALEQPSYEQPQLEVENMDILPDFDVNSFKLSGYEHGPFIKAPIAS